MILQNPRKYGVPPFNIVVVHGGPGACGEMAPVARGLSSGFGVLEPLQTAITIDGQVKELEEAIRTHGNPPVALVGHSWGAWLAFILAAKNPSLVGKLVLVGSGPFEEKYASEIMPARLSRLPENERNELALLLKKMESQGEKDSDAIMDRVGDLISKSDHFDPLPLEPEPVEFRPEVYQSVWPEASRLRQSGELLEMGKKITCPVVAIHGDHDPHPADGVRIPLEKVLKDFKFVLLEKCGHDPWLEKHAREKFFEVLKGELGSKI
ncbi:MAG TPA: alpha/beta hydrolase [Caldisericia bacterium]|nr:alpha/beta hydrolase [Caldisericia bacterium]HOC79765.1 alpha/beta hydrolase [Caldisericia bacterium]HOG70718.1 alpha/beta hydrolase [Caldisericia bacterium]HPA65106.1 alpha/beta hydrolase [Caldisericia bacterium]HPV86862.1 alpha/beta hydrolase [Caldisericia bacterium]